MLCRRYLLLLIFVTSQPQNLIDLTKIKEEVENDDRLTQIMEELEEEDGNRDSKYSIQQGMLRYRDRLVVSKSSVLIPTLLHTYHDSVFWGHSGFLRTYKRLASELYWEDMKQDVKKYCEECLIFQKNKTMTL